MSLFGRNKHTKSVLPAAIAAAQEVEKQLDSAKSERNDAVRENIEARDYTNNLLRKNGFTLTLYFAAHNPAIKKG